MQKVTLPSSIAWIDIQHFQGRLFFDEVDRVYVLVTGGQVDLLFTRGEVGTFGGRSGNYKAYLACGVATSRKVIDLYFLGEPLRKAIVETSEIFQISEQPGVRAADLLYVREGATFAFSRGQHFEPSIIEVLKGTTLD